MRSGNSPEHREGPFKNFLARRAGLGNSGKNSFENRLFGDRKFRRNITTAEEDLAARNAQEERRSLVLKAAGVAGGALALGGSLLSASNANAEPNPAILPPGTPTPAPARTAIYETLPANFPSTHNSKLGVSPTPIPLESKPKVSSAVNVEASTTITDTLPLVSKEQVQAEIFTVRDAFLETDLQGDVSNIYVVVGLPGDTGADLYVFVSSLDNGKFSKFTALNSQKLSIDISRLSVKGSGLVASGIDNSNPSSLLSQDRGGEYRLLSLPIDQSTWAFYGVEQIPITGTNKVVVNIPSTETSKTMAIVDMNTGIAVKADWGNLDYSVRGALAFGSLSQDKNIAVIYSSVNQFSTWESGYLVHTINLSTGQTTTVRKHMDWGGPLDSIFLQHDNAGSVSKMMAVNGSRQAVYLSDNPDTASEVVTGIPVQSLLDDKNISNLYPGTFTPGYGIIVGNSIWVAGSYGTVDTDGGPAIVSWPLDVDPNAYPETVKFYPAAGFLKWGKFGEKYGLLVTGQTIDVRGSKLIFLETAFDGSPLVNAEIVYPDDGLDQKPAVAPSSTPTNSSSPSVSSSPTQQENTPTPTGTATAMATQISPSPSPSPTAIVGAVCQQGWKYFEKIGKCLKQVALLPFVIRD